MCVSVSNAEKSVNAKFPIIFSGGVVTYDIVGNLIILRVILIFRGHEIAVDWAEPEPEVDTDTMSKVTVLYVRNLMLSTTEDSIRDRFNLVTDGNVEKVKKMRDFAFVHFMNREKAEMAKQLLNSEFN